MIAKLITKLFNFILNVILTLVSTLLSPLTSLVSNALPDLSSFVTSINNFINTAFNNIGYFLSMLGPFTKSVILLELNLLSIFFTIYAGYITLEITIHLITKIKSMFN